MAKIEKMIEAYNKKAKKWGYETLNVENGKLVGEFKEKESINESFFKRFKTLYRNGYLKEDFDKIKKELNG